MHRFVRTVYIHSFNKETQKYDIRDYAGSSSTNRMMSELCEDYVSYDQAVIPSRTNNSPNGMVFLLKRYWLGLKGFDIVEIEVPTLSTFFDMKKFLGEEVTDNPNYEIVNLLKDWKKK